MRNVNVTEKTIRIVVLSTWRSGSSFLGKFTELLKRKMIDTEEKAKVVAAVWGTEFIQFLAAAAILHWDELKNRMNLNYTRTI